MAHGAASRQGPFVLLFATALASCSGAAGTTQVQPPPATHEQAQLIASARFQAQDAAASPISGTPQDVGTLLPLESLRARNVAGIIPMAITSCSLTTACVGGTNSSTGPGVSGVSAHGKGVTGTTTSASTTAANGQFAVYGQDSSGSGAFDVGVYGISVRGVGTSGKSTSNYGVRGNSSSSYGVAGFSANAIGVFGSGPQGVSGAGGTIGVSGNGTTWGIYGINTSTPPPDGSFGPAAVYGTSTNNPGAIGQSTYGVGVVGKSANHTGVYGSGPSIGVEGVGGNYGVEGTGSLFGGFFESNTNTGEAVAGWALNSGTGVYAQSDTGDGVYATSQLGYALEAHSGNALTSAYITNSTGSGADITGQYIGVIARAPAGTSSFPLVATDTNGNHVFYVNGNGDVYYHGTLHTFATTSNGRVTAFTTQSTRPSIEDTGTARVVDGRAIVELDPTFARTLDTQRTYQVFLTPGGDTRGLYVASKSPSQFVVREVQGGHGTFPFDYHIYGTALGKATQHMTFMQPHARLLPAPQHPLGRQPMPKLIKP